MKQFKPVCIFGSALLCTVSNLNAQEIREPVPVSIGVPSGFGAAGGLVFGSVSYTDSAPNTGNSGDEDGSIGVGFGVGDPTRSFGVEFTVGITSVSSPFWGDGRFADEGNLNIKFHRIVDGLPGASYAAISLGFDNFAGWGTTVDYPVESYIAYSQVNHFQFGDFLLPTEITLGWGSAVSDFGQSPAAFGSIGFGLTPSLSAGVGLYGDELNLGAVIFPEQFEMASMSASYVWQADERFSEGRYILSLSLALDNWR